MTINYKYNEGDLLRQITDYVNSTYDGHYSQNQYQATEFIIDGGHGIGFTIGNIMKYAQRYGHKGTPEDWRKDLMKVIHYAIIALYVHDKEQHELDFLDLEERLHNLTLEPVIPYNAFPTVDLSNYPVGDTVSLKVTGPIDLSNYNMGSSLLTSDESFSIINTETKSSKKKKKD